MSINLCSEVQPKKGKCYQQCILSNELKDRMTIHPEPCKYPCPLHVTIRLDNLANSLGGVFT